MEWADIETCPCGPEALSVFTRHSCESCENRCVCIRSWISKSKSKKVVLENFFPSREARFPVSQRSRKIWCSSDRLSRRTIQRGSCQPAGISGLGCVRHASIRTRILLSKEFRIGATVLPKVDRSRKSSNIAQSLSDNSRVALRALIPLFPFLFSNLINN